MELICRSCLCEYDGSIFKDALGWHGVCPDCGASFPVTLPQAEYIMAFADDSDPTCDMKRFVDSFDDATALSAYYTFDTVEALADAWNEMVEEPDGMWYFIVHNGATIVSGAYDAGDEDYLEELEGWPTT